MDLSISLLSYILFSPSLILFFAAKERDKKKESEFGLFPVGVLTKPILKMLGFFKSDLIEVTNEDSLYSNCNSLGNKLSQL